MLKFGAMFCVLVIMLGINIEFISYTAYSGLLKGSILSIVLICGALLFANYLCIIGLINIKKANF